MKKINKQLAVLLPLAVVADIVLLIFMIALSISQTSTLGMFFSPFDSFWQSNFIIDICLKNICIVLSVFSVILVVQLIVYHRIGERIGRYHKKIALCLTVAFVAAVALAVAVPATQFSYNLIEVNTYESEQSVTPPDSPDLRLFPYFEEMASPVGEVNGTWGSADIYTTKRDKYIGIFEDGEGDRRYIVEFFQSDSKLLREKFHAEALFYPQADAVSGEQDGIAYTAFYEHEDLSGTPFITFEAMLEADNAICFIYLYNTEDAFNENTQALLDTAAKQFRLLQETTNE